MSNEPPPPWIVLPDLGPDDPATQGIAEAYVDLEWLPFWLSLPPERKAAYLDRWQTSRAWREAIDLRYEANGVAMAQEARDHAASEAARKTSPVVAILGLGYGVRVRRWLTGSIVVLVLLAVLLMGEVMRGPDRMFRSAAPAVLLWEGAAGREPVQFVSIVIVKIKRADGGLFGIGRSPSIPGGFPDAREIIAKTLDSSGARMTVHAPSAYLPHRLASGQHMVLGLSDEGRVIRFFVPGPEIPAEKLTDWATQSARATR
jgi:hypothetical protein